MGLIDDKAIKIITGSKFGLTSASQNLEFYFKENGETTDLTFINLFSLQCTCFLKRANHFERVGRKIIRPKLQNEAWRRDHQKGETSMSSDNTQKHYNAIHQAYDCREDFILIGLTGRTGSGCSTTASILGKDKNELDLPRPYGDELKENDFRKYQIIYNYIHTNWEPFEVIKVTDFITSFFFKSKFNKFKDYVSSTLLEDTKCKEKVEIEIADLQSEFKRIKDLGSKINLKGIKSKGNIYNDESKLKIFYKNELPKFRKKLKNIFNKYSNHYYIKLYQAVGDNIRSSGSAFDPTYKPESIFTLSNEINNFIKILRNRIKNENIQLANVLKNKKRTYVVLDCIRNPFEALFFRERYSAFYLMALNSPDEQRKDRLRRLKESKLTDTEINKLDEKEYNGKKSGKDLFVSQNIQKCYDLADIHIHNPQIGENNFTFLKRGLAKYISLIMHPGIVTPSSIERCMQTAHTAKLNSGCLSRHVGAVITDKNFSIKAIGWNDVPKGQVPCILRNTKALIKHEDKLAFSDYEKNNEKFREEIENKYNGSKTEEVKRNLAGRNVPFCFKDIQNSLDNKGNQVHTRALHAEENAFLQITKYGGMGIKGGYLFTTSSPCELCAKKAHQLGIKKIYYLDPYPGLSDNHVLASGKNRPKLQLFCGAIGRAYHQLYEPILSYKDELEIMGYQTTNIVIPIKIDKSQNKKIDNILSTRSSKNRAEKKSEFIRKAINYYIASHE